MVPGTGIETGTRSTTSLRSVAQDRLFRDPDFKLRRFAGVSAAGATRRNPEAQRGISAWCPGPESNRYVPFGTRDFKSRASASFATRAGQKLSLSWHKTSSAAVGSVWEGVRG